MIYYCLFCSSVLGMAAIPSSHPEVFASEKKICFLRDCLLSPGEATYTVVWGVCRKTCIQGLYSWLVLGAAVPIVAGAISFCRPCPPHRTGTAEMTHFSLDIV